MKTISINSLFLLLLIINPNNPAFAASGGGSSAAASKYFSLNPPMVVNVTDKGRVRHLQIGIQFRLEDPADSELLQEHKPALQHEMVMLLSGREAQSIRTVKGKEELRTEATEVVKKMLTESIGKPVITAVYFTTFVIQ